MSTGRNRRKREHRFEAGEKRLVKPDYIAEEKTMDRQETGLTKLQETELEILRVFIEVCSRLSLKYYLLAGTLLGAVRHRGFIPWDDDIDVAMFRKDYEVFLA